MPKNIIELSDFLHTKAKSFITNSFSKGEAVEDWPRLNSTIVQLLNDQAEAEYLSSLIYQAASLWMADNGWIGGQALFQQYAGEEVAHATKIYAYITDKNATGKAPQGIESYQTSYPDVKGCLTQSLMHEMVVTERWHTIASMAMALKDFDTFELAQSFLKEQVEEENKFRDFLFKIKQNMPDYELDELFAECVKKGEEDQLEKGIQGKIPVKLTVQKKGGKAFQQTFWVNSQEEAKALIAKHSGAKNTNDPIDHHSMFESTLKHINDLESKGQKVPKHLQDTLDYHKVKRQQHSNPDLSLGELLTGLFTQGNHSSMFENTLKHIQHLEATGQKVPNHLQNTLDYHKFNRDSESESQVKTPIRSFDLENGYTAKVTYQGDEGSVGDVYDGDKKIGEWEFDHSSNAFWVEGSKQQIAFDTRKELGAYFRRNNPKVGDKVSVEGKDGSFTFTGEKTKEGWHILSDNLGGAPMQAKVVDGKWIAKTKEQMQASVKKFQAEAKAKKNGDVASFEPNTADFPINENIEIGANHQVLAQQGTLTGKAFKEIQDFLPDHLTDLEIGGEGKGGFNIKIYDEQDARFVSKVLAKYALRSNIMSFGQEGIDATADILESTTKTTIASLAKQSTMTSDQVQQLKDNLGKVNKMSLESWERMRGIVAKMKSEDIAKMMVTKVPNIAYIGLQELNKRHPNLK